MPEENENRRSNFHEFALHSGLFKGRPDFYFSYLKAERLAHAIARLAYGQGAPQGDVLDSLLRTSSSLPGALARFAAGEIEEAGILADLFEILALVRLCVTHGLIVERNARILVEEYEGIGYKIDLGKHVSPFIALEDLAVPNLNLEAPAPAPTVRQNIPAPVKDTNNVLDKNKGQTQRSAQILAFIRKSKRASIKEIANVVRGVSEKTIQRELALLIEKGLIRKEGERRWSVYFPM